MKLITDWPALAEQNTAIVAVEYHTPDRMQILQQFYNWGEDRSLSVFVWNPGYCRLQQLIRHQSQYILQSTDRGKKGDIIQYLLEEYQPGIYLLEGVLNESDGSKISQKCSYQLLNAYHQALWSKQHHYWVLLETYVQLPLELQPFIPILSNPLPDKEQVQLVVQQFCDTWVGRSDHRLKNCAECDRYSSLKTTEKTEALRSLFRACQGLPIGEINMLLQQCLGFAAQLEEIAQLVLKHKVNKLRGRGLEYIAQPDVPSAGGLDLLEKRLETITYLLQTEAEQYGLKFPTGMLLWGPPGTGKSLSAKLAAKKMGLPLLAANWGVLLSASHPDRALKEFIALVTSLAPCVLYWDDFDKGFAGWDSNADGGIARRLSAALLTWMQEHQEPVYTIATVNRLEMLPAELVRRFDDIFFMDLPHEGARYEVFNLHLAKYFPAFRNNNSPWSDDQWHKLLAEYRICSPAEIGNAVRRCAEEAFYQSRPGEIEFEDLLKQRQEFTPAMERESEQIQAIRNQAIYAKPVAGQDVSRFAYQHRELFG
ncbi:MULTISPECIES: AAA family ATPase [unclassified Tolypothrix]|uniref:AAA family ATPase n=1 Tax=unclassified Tolypothrix TaxID=2649714 RepID=UPI0005EABBE8|nr:MULTISPECIES: AAA family ATPase [unclassified Tolypothrix]BAY95583.1 AAA ATPase central domain-containing protein [Microchaete diplosiphon NIES-3275]EKE98350.1 ATPase, AAA family [Tolypothrix sp. PCC 7601]MBE9084704.1 AAA family ATPase [Tolypothrix sp. LEGE 11397]UYD30632.1 AAA family ATPase [Tolypothrix sp. PCC 7712]UYD38535.1 AAA family ATPase [Tolypothrix sp. PCC 7601]